MEGLTIGFHLAIITGLAYFIWRKQSDLIFWPALILKLICGILVGLLYKYYYTAGDTWTFFDDGVKVLAALAENPNRIFDFFWNDGLLGIEENLDAGRARTMYLVKWVVFFNFLGGNNYWVTSLYFSFFSFLGSWVFYRTLAANFSNFKREAGIAILFVPSIIFWGSGLIKECLAIGALLFIAAQFISWYFKHAITIFQVLVFLIMIWIVWNIKYYWLAVWLAVAMPIVANHFLKKQFSWANKNPKWTWLILLVVAIVAVSVTHPNFYFNRLFSVIAKNHDAYIEISNPNDVIHYYKLDSSTISILSNSPWALMSGIFRPLIFEASNLLQLAASVENLALLILFGLTIYRWKKFRNQISELHLAVIFYVIILSVFLALSTPNFGTLSRFKIAYTPFLWFALLSASGILKRIKFLNPK